MDSRNISVSFIGAGNVASHLALALHSKGVRILQIASKHGFSARALAERVGAQAVDISSIVDPADFLIIAVSDSAVPEVVKNSNTVSERTIVAHTCGSVGMSVFPMSANAGVLYPFQTFSKDVKISIEDTPFFIEASNEETKDKLFALARLLSDKVYYADSDTRKYIHLAGVLTSNFPVYLAALAQNELKKVGIPLDVVKPLMQATIDKLFEVGSEKALTGPARRGDKTTTNAQGRLLDGTPRLIYDLITDEIIKHYHREQN